MSPDVPVGSWIDSDVPVRLDALGWSRWHRRIVLALGITWVLDGLEASLIANLAPTLQDHRTLGLSAAQIGLANTVYLAGQVAGALGFGHLTDRFGRKRLFLVTLGLYLAATAASGLFAIFPVFLIFRFLAGGGIGGEYAAINSAIDELVPARLRGQIDLAINGSYWIGIAMGAGLTLVVLDPSIIPITLGWRVSFLLGALLGLGILIVRRHVPESPRWLLLHGYTQAAHDTVLAIEREVGAAPTERTSVRVHVTGSVGLRHLIHVLLRRYPRRAVLGTVLMFSQAFLYNAIFFSYALVLRVFHGVAPSRVGLYVVPVAIGNFLGPVVLGPLFDRFGRRTMIPLTYAGSGILLAITGWLFVEDKLTAFTQTLAWSAVFFVASAAASSAYLTVSELFPVALRGRAIAVFYAFGTLVGAGSPVLFGHLIDAGDPWQLFDGYLVAAALMVVAAVVARKLGVAAEGRPLEELSSDHELIEGPR
jgi:MFS family permease